MDPQTVEGGLDLYTYFLDYFASAQVDQFFWLETGFIELQPKFGGKRTLYTDIYL